MDTHRGIWCIRYVFIIIIPFSGLVLGVGWGGGGRGVRPSQHFA